MARNRSKALDAALTSAISAVIRAQAEAEISGSDGADHDLFLIRLELQRIRDHGGSFPRVIPGQTDLLSELGAKHPRATPTTRA